MRVLITGSSGLIGSAVVEYFDRNGHETVGVDNNMRRVFFGPTGDTTWNLHRLTEATERFAHVDLDIRDRDGVNELFSSQAFDLIVHCAAQPSHDLARTMPIVDFEVNAVGTLNLLEAMRNHCAEAPFVLMSTNKVYGDAPNELPLVENEYRYDYARPEDHAGIDETCRIDRSLHSLFGASKAAADLMAQEYGRTFGLPVGIFRGGCLTGPAHSGVELHGFLSHLIRVAVGEHDYTVIGYKGKQVRDQIHAEDVARAIEAFAANPRPGEVYNIGGQRPNSASVLECIRMIEDRLGKPLEWVYEPQARLGDHICYISDMTKFKSDYPEWTPRHTLDSIVDSMLDAELSRAHEAAGEDPRAVSTVLKPASGPDRVRNVDAVVVHYNDVVETQRAVATIACMPCIESVTVVDNRGDAELDMLVSACGARVVRAGRNIGFGRGVNRGVELNSSEFILVVNPDVALTESVLERLCRAMECPATAAAAPVLELPSGHTQSGCGGAAPSLRTVVAYAFGIAALPGMRLTRTLFHPPVPPPDSAASGNESAGHGGVVDVDWVAAACMLVRRSAFEAVGGFDPAFFMYGEDIDFGVRCRKAGWRVALCTDSSVVHDSMPAPCPERRAKTAWLRGLNECLRRHTPHSRRLSMLVLTIGFVARSIGRAARLHRRPPGARAMLAYAWSSLGLAVRP